MAKLGRNRLMHFGSWTGRPVEESAAAEYFGSGITGVSVEKEKFGTGVSKITGEYVFLYDGVNWTLNDTTVTLETGYGLTVTGTPEDGDSITVMYTAASGGWEALGKDNDDLSKELNPDTETGKNVLGESTFTHSGYEPELDLDPYYADPSRKLYNHLREIAIQEKYGENDCLGYFAEAYFTSVNATARTMSGYCYVRQAWFVPQSTGGDTSGLAIPFKVQPVGAMTKKSIVYDMSTNEATITDPAGDVSLTAEVAAQSTMETAKAVKSTKGEE